jgi:hypothetical protein
MSEKGGEYTIMSMLFGGNCGTTSTESPWIMT